MEIDINKETDNDFEQTQVLMAGVGESGCRAVMVIAKDFNISGMKPVLANKQVELNKLRFSKAERIDLDIEWREDYRRCLQNIGYAFILVKLGGEMETNAVKIMAKTTADMNIPYVVFAQMPSQQYTSMTEMTAANKALETLKGLSNACVVIPDDTLFQTIPGDIPVVEAYERATRWFAEAVSGVALPFASQNISNTDAPRLEWLLKHKGSTCSAGFGRGQGAKATDEAIKQFMQSPFLSHLTEVFAVDAALVIVSVSANTTRDQAHQAMKRIKAKFDEKINLASCLCLDETLDDGIRITALLRNTEPPAEVAEADAKSNTAKTNTNLPRKQAGRKSKDSDKQILFDFFVKQNNLGIFSAEEPTMHDGENLDEPTYSRWHV